MITYHFFVVPLIYTLISKQMPIGFPIVFAALLITLRQHFVRHGEHITTASSSPSLPASSFVYWCQVLKNLYHLRVSWLKFLCCAFVVFLTGVVVKCPPTPPFFADTLLLSAAFILVLETPAKVSEALSVYLTAVQETESTVKLELQALSDVLVQGNDLPVIAQASCCTLLYIVYCVLYCTKHPEFYCVLVIAL